MIPVVDISVGNIPFDFIHAATVKSSWELFTDTATLVFPSNLKVDRNNLKELIKNGDPVQVKWGVKSPIGNGLQTVFKGYLTGLKPSIPIEMQCEDEMWMLKQDRITNTIKDATIADLMKAHFSQWNPHFIDAQLGKQYVIDNATPAQILDDLKKKTGLYSFMRDGRLVVGCKYDPEQTTVHKFEIYKNVISDDLVFKRKEDVRLEIKAISMKPDGSKIEQTVGDKGGESQTMTFYDVSKEDLKAAAERELEKRKYDGFRGSFTAFGVPQVKHGEQVEILHPEASDKAGIYWVDEVVSEMSVDGGIRQKIKLGPLV